MVSLPEYLGQCTRPDGLRLKSIAARVAMAYRSMAPAHPSKRALELLFQLRNFDIALSSG
jgi:hypothetical protein